MRGKHIGKCALCGKKRELTFEHIPPRSAFNWFPAKIVTSTTILRAISTGSRPWDFSGLPYDDSQRGMGAYTLCKTCNNNTGHWYGADYVNFVLGIHCAMLTVQPQAGTSLTIENDKFRPLPVMKQVISMFCSLNHSAIIGEKHRALREYVLDKTLNVFPKDQYRLGMYLFINGIQRRVPITVQIQTCKGKEPVMEALTEIATYPIGFVLYLEPNSDLKMPFADITALCECGYQEEYKVEIPLPVYQCNTLFPNDFRSQKEIERNINMAEKKKVNNE